MTLNQVALETKQGDLEKSMALMLETQAKMQEGLNQLLNGNVVPQIRNSILGSGHPSNCATMTQKQPFA